MLNSPSIIINDKKRIISARLYALARMGSVS